MCASLAEQLQARALLLPGLNAGVDVDLHRGNLQSGTGIIRDVNRESLAVRGGGGIRAGTATIPGVRLFSQLADAIYEPRVAQHVGVFARRFEATATDNSILLDVATRYFDLVGAEEWLRSIRQSEKDLDVVVTLTANFAKSGQGRQGDADRAASEAQLLHAEEITGARRGRRGRCGTGSPTRPGPRVPASRRRRSDPAGPTRRSGTHPAPFARGRSVEPTGTRGCRSGNRPAGNTLASGKGPTTVAASVGWLEAPMVSAVAATKVRRAWAIWPAEPMSTSTRSGPRESRHRQRSHPETAAGRGG